MTEILIESAVNIMATLLITLISVLGTWLTMKLAKRQELATINAAQQEVIALAEQTAGELQQTVVEGLKAAHSDGRLTKDEIAMLGGLLIEKTKEKMSIAAMKLLTATAVDVNALIIGAGENWINALKQRS